MSELSDVRFLQETRLLSHDVSVLDSLNEYFLSFSISAVDSGELLTGRPCGRLSISLRKSIDNMCKLLNFADKRLFGLQNTIDEINLIAINTYFP